MGWPTANRFGFVLQNRPSALLRPFGFVLHFPIIRPTLPIGFVLHPAPALHPNWVRFAKTPSAALPEPAPTLAPSKPLASFCKMPPTTTKARYNGGVGFPRILAALCVPAVLYCATPIMPLSDIKAGMRATGRTVFKGTQPEDFQAEIIGVLENIGPRQSIILARLSGGPLEKTGVMQGMSGSPVYIDGKLIGAVALTFAFSKEPIAGIRPIGEMLEIQREPRTTRATTTTVAADPLANIRKPEDVLAGSARLVEIATPVSFNGFTRSTIEHFAPRLRAVGLEPVQGVGTGKPAGFGDPSLIQPGSMISVQLLSGDMTVGAEGTVTHVDGKNIYGFGHRFLSVGATDLPFARAEVLTLLPNLSTSFKISSAREWMGTITQDRSVGIAGSLGRQADLVPLTVNVSDPDSKTPRPIRYSMRMVNDRVLAPLLVQMAVYSAIEATERTLGTGSFRIKGEVSFADGNVPPIKLNNIYAGDFNVPLQVSLGASIPLSYVLQSGFDTLKLRDITIDVEAYDRKKQLAIDQVWTSTRDVRPGESFDVTAVLTGENGAEITRTARYTVPVGASPGPIYITVADGSTTNMNEYQQYIGTAPKNPAQLVGFLNSFRANNKAYVRLWRADTAFTVQGHDLPDTPPSVSMLLSKTQASFSGGLWRGSKLAEFELPAGDSVVSGNKTIQVEVKE